MDKKSLREYLISKRQGIIERDCKNACIKSKVLDISKNYNTIGIYVSVQDEIDTYEIIKELFLQNKIVVVPKCVGDDLEFVQISSFSELKKGYFGLYEPISNEYINKNSIDIMIVPLLGYDSSFNRIGYGKGFYDRYLQDYLGYKVGIAYHELRVESVYADNNDVLLDIVLTDEDC